MVEEMAVERVEADHLLDVLTLIRLRKAMLTCSPILKCYPSPLYKLWLRSTLNLQTISMLLRNKEKLKATKAKSRQIKRKQKIA